MLITLTVDRFEEDKAVLKTEDGQSIIWPKDQLPDNAHEGMVLNFAISDNKVAEKNNRQIAKDILNEILDIKE
jgi:hypothetical protein